MFKIKRDLFSRCTLIEIFNFTRRSFCDKIRAVLQTGIGGYETLYVGETEMPKLKEDEVLMKVEAFSLNRADMN